MNKKQKILLMSFIISQVLLTLLVVSPNFFGVNISPPEGYSLGSKIVIGTTLLLGSIMLYALLFSKKQAIKFPIKTIIVISSMVWGVYTILPPLGSQDVFFYIGEGRTLSIYHENPYLTPIDTFPQDPAWHLVYYEWRQKPGIYGPIWTGIEAGITYIFQDLGISDQVLVFQILSLLAHAGISWCIYGILQKEKGRKVAIAGALFYAWNPIVLFEFVNNAHNDIWGILFVMLALLMNAKKKSVWSVILLTIAGLMKMNFFIILPIYFVYLLSKKGRQQEKLKILLYYSSIAAAATLLAYIPWYSGPEIFAQLFGRTSMFVRGSMPFVYTMGYAAVFLKELPHEDAMSIGQRTAQITFLLGYIVILWRVYQKKSKNLPQIIAITTLLTMLTIAPSMQPWYFLWAAAFLVLGKYYKTVMILSFFAILYYLQGFTTYIVFYALFPFITIIYWYEYKKFLKEK